MPVTLWHDGPMQRVHVDRFGRILIPKRTRKQLGLTEGAGLQLEVAGDTIVLRPALPDGELVRERGVLVWDGRALEIDVNDLIQQTRAERIRSIVGLKP